MCKIGYMSADQTKFKIISNCFYFLFSNIMLYIFTVLYKRDLSQHSHKESGGLFLQMKDRENGLEY